MAGVVDGGREGGGLCWVFVVRWVRGDGRGRGLCGVGWWGWGWDRGRGCGGVLGGLVEEYRGRCGVGKGCGVE